jgi:hypothetical protein
MSNQEFEEAAKEVMAIPRDQLPSDADRAFLISEALAGHVSAYTPVSSPKVNLWWELAGVRQPLADWLHVRHAGDDREHDQ